METKTGRRKLMPVILGVSLAANLAVLAAVGAAALRHHGGDDYRRKGVSGQALYLKALPVADRRALRDSFHTTRSARTQHYPRMLEALRADPFDPDLAQQVLAAQRGEILARQDRTSAAWLARIAEMSGPERAAYADRLDDLLKHRRAGRTAHQAGG